MRKFEMIRLDLNGENGCDASVVREPGFKYTNDCSLLIVILEYTFGISVKSRWLL